MNGIEQPFWVIVNKEIRDHVRSWRFIILLAIITLTCLGALYTSLTSMHEAVKSGDVEDTFFFLKLFTVSDGTLPSFVLFINFLGPLLGIALGFDAMNSELNKGTLCRILSQPIHRDCIINAKFVAALIVITIMLFVLGFLVMGAGLIAIGIADLAKYEELDDAQEQIEQLQVELRRFKTELADVEITADLQVTVDSFLKFADFFFDGLFADWAVLDHINQAQSRVENTKDQIKRVLALLKKMREDVDVQIADEKEKQEQLAVETEL